MSESLEVERTLTVPAGWTLPDLSTVDGVAAVRDLGSATLDATYLDTLGLHLLRRGITFRRREGGDDEGWHLKLPSGPGRTEVHAPLDTAASTTADATADTTAGPLTPPAVPAVPAVLAALVDGVRLGGTVAPVAHLRTDRATTLLLGPDDEPLASVTVDDVRSSADGRDEAWREIEVELDRGDAALLARVVDALVASGAEVAAIPVKLERALGVTASFYRPRTPAVPRTGGDLVTRYLREQVDALLDADPRVRRDEPDAVHAARVATRRLRSTLRTFRSVLDRVVVDPLRDELRWWGGELGLARDREVQRDRVVALLDGLPDELVVGPVSARLATTLDAGYRTAHREAVATMGTDRYRDLLVRLDALADHPPLRGCAGRPAADVAARVVRTAARRTRHRMWAVERVLDDLTRASGTRPLGVPLPASAPADPPGSPPPDISPADRADPAEPGTRGPDATHARLADALHEARKKAKATRYAAEAAEPVVGQPAADLAAAFEALQDVLGAHHDAVVLADLFRSEGMRAHLAGENGFTYGLLVGLERGRAQTALAEVAGAWAAADRRRLRRWTRDA